MAVDLSKFGVDLNLTARAHIEADRVFEESFKTLNNIRSGWSSKPDVWGLVEVSDEHPVHRVYQLTTGKNAQMMIVVQVAVAAQGLPRITVASFKPDAGWSAAWTGAALKASRSLQDAYSAAGFFDYEDQ